MWLHRLYGCIEQVVFHVRVLTDCTWPLIWLRVIGTPHVMPHVMVSARCTTSHVMALSCTKFLHSQFICTITHNMVWKSQTAGRHPSEIDEYNTPAKTRKRHATQPEACSCRRSKCVKLYCVCFASARACDEGCRCNKVQCGNGGDRDPDDSPHIQSSHQPCRCKRSRCLKRYCECFSNHKNCSGCKCIGCENKEASGVAEITEAADAWCKTTQKHFNWNLVAPLVQLTPEECGEMVARPKSAGRLRLSVTRLSARTTLFRVIGTVQERGCVWPTMHECN